MSRYVNHKHGLCIGSDNVYFVIDTAIREQEGEPPLILPDGVDEIRDDYRAIVTFYQYYFDQFNTLNVFVRTPADQLVWKLNKLEWETTWEHQGTTHNIPRECNYRTLSPWFENWLNVNVGPRYQAWDTYTRNNRNSPCVFFKRRKDALAFVREIDRHLHGIKFANF